MSEELKPCPLCGGKPYLANVAMLGCSYVVCTDCRLQTDDGNKERVSQIWNTRAAPTVTPEQAARVLLGLDGNPVMQKVYDACSGRSKVHKFNSVLRVIMNNEVAK